MSSSQLPDIGGGGMPGSSGPSGGKPGEEGENGGERETADQSGGSGGSSGVPTWDDRGQGDGSGSEWEKSNQAPEVPVDISAKGEGAGAGTDGVPGKGGAAGDLEDALEDFDGGIMAERSAIRDRAAQTPNAGGGKGSGSTGIPGSGTDGDGEGRVVGTGGGVGSLPDGPSTISKAPGAPMRSAGIPKDVDDARDDDVIARQLREAAMAETDPAIREKLWADYQKYKKR